MHQQPQGESIWGTINTSIEIALDIYMIFAKDENGVERTGIMAKKDTAEKNLSAKAVAMGEQDGDWLCYDENTKEIPLYEVLQRRVAACKRVEKATIKEMAEIKRDGKLNLTDYFGECLPPADSQYGAISKMQKFRNGIYFTQDSDKLQFAVHEAIADSYMSPIAAEFGSRNGDYLFYDTTTCAVALNELKNVFDEAEGLIVSEDSLNATLCQHFRVYTTTYNDIMQVEYQIPEVSAPTALFLAVQLENAMQAEQQDAAQPELREVTTPQLEQDFNEEADFEVG